MELTSRLATLADCRASSAWLIEDGTYFVVETTKGGVAGCGGWSRRATIAYGFIALERLDASLTDAPVPCVRMTKPIRR